MKAIKRQGGGLGPWVGPGFTGSTPYVPLSAEAVAEASEHLRRDATSSPAELDRLMTRYQVLRARVRHLQAVLDVAEANLTVVETMMVDGAR